MIVSFADKETRRFFAGERVRRFESISRQAMRRLQILDEAASIEDLMGLPSHRFEALRGDRSGQYSIRINDQWRICFHFQDGETSDVEITDYH